MYIPKHFENKNQDDILGFMKQFNFASIVSVLDGRPVATHIPFLVSSRREKIILRGHMAKANMQWRTLENKNEVLVIFSEPHSYISPKLYETEENVPTWNYIAIHAYGIPELYLDDDNKIKILEESFEAFEESYKQQWNVLSEIYKKRLLKGIVAFQIELTSIESKFKLSQNHSETERVKIIEHLSASDESIKNEVANYMRKLK